MNPLLQGDDLYLRGDYKSAFTFYSTFLASNFTHECAPEASLRAGQSLLRLNQVTAAAEQLSKTLQMRASADVRAMAAKSLGDALRMSEDFAGAARQYEAALNERRAVIDLDETVFCMGIALLRSGEWDKGYDVMKGLVSRVPDSEFGRQAKDKLNYGKRAFTVQLGIFRDKDNAAKRLQELTAKGVRGCVIEQQTMRDEEMHCVRKGSYPTFNEARKQAESWIKAGIDAVVIP